MTLRANFGRGVGPSMVPLVRNLTPTKNTKIRSIVDERVLPIRWPARQERNKCRTDGVDIALRVEHLITTLFGTHEVNCSCNDSPWLIGANLHSTILGQQQVDWLDIPMQYPWTMCCIDPQAGFADPTKPFACFVKSTTEPPAKISITKQSTFASVRKS